MKSVTLIINISILVLASQSAILTHQHHYHTRPESKKMSVNIGDGVGPNSVDIEAAPGEDAQAFDDTTHVDKPLEVHHDEEHEEVDEWDLPDEDWEHNELDQAEMDEINEEGQDHHVSFPEDTENFEEKQKLLMDLIEKLTQIRTENSHVAQVEIDLTDLQVIEGLMKGFYDLREHDQSIALHGGDHEEEDEEEDWYNESEKSHEGSEYHDWDDVEEHNEEEEEQNSENEFWAEDHDGSHPVYENDEEGEGEWEHHHEEEGEWEHHHEDGEGEDEHEHEDEHHEEEHDEESDWEHVESAINHEEEIADEEHHEHEEGSESTEDLEETEKEFFAKLNETKMSYDDLTQVSLVVDGLMKKYNNMFLDFPKEISNNIETETQELEKTYERIKEFIHDVVEKKDSIHKEVEFLKEQFSSVKFSREEVLEFYSYHSLWEELDHHADATDEDWQQKKKILDLEVTEFVENIKEVMKNLHSVESLQNLIWSETQFVRDQMNSEKSVTVKDKIVGLPTLIQKLIEIKFDVDKDLNNTILKITQVKEQKSQFRESMTDMQVYLGLEKTLREGASRMQIFGLTFFFLALIMKIERD